MSERKKPMQNPLPQNLVPSQIPLPPIPLITTSNNPGTVDPASQSFPAPPNGTAPFASTSVTNSDGEAQRLNLTPHQVGSNGVTVTPASAALVNSNGESQRLSVDIHQTANSGVTVSHSTAPTVNVSGDDWQRPNLATPDVAAITGTGLPTEVHAGSASAVKWTPPQLATPPQITTPMRPVVALPANTGIRNTGLPKNVNVR